MAQWKPRPEPPVVDDEKHRLVTDDRVEWKRDVVEELLAEGVVAVDLRDRLDGHARRVERDDEHGEPRVLGNVPVRTGETQREVGRLCARAPDLRAVERRIAAGICGSHKRWRRHDHTRKYR